MKITLTGVFVWKDNTGAVKSNVAGAVKNVYTIWRNKIGLPVVTDITASCVVALTAVDATSGIFTIEAEWNPTTISVDDFMVVVKDATLNSNIFLQAKMPRDKKDHLVINLRS